MRKLVVKRLTIVHEAHGCLGKIWRLSDWSSKNCKKKKKKKKNERKKDGWACTDSLYVARNCASNFRFQILANNTGGILIVDSATI